MGEKNKNNGGIGMALNRLNDYLFKWIFGNESRKATLLDLINAVLTNGSDENIIVDIKYKDRELDPQKINDKRANLDILAETCQGTLINIEIQVENTYDIDHRMLYYWAKNFSLQLVSGGDYKDLKDTICICIMNFNYFERKRYHSFYKVLETVDHEPLNSDMQMHFIELKKWAALKKKAANRLEKWLLYFANNNPADLEKAATENKYIAGAIAAESNFGLDEGERYWYDMREKFLTDQGAISAKLKKIEKFEQKIAENEQKIAESEQRIAENELKIAESEQKIAEKDQKLAKAEVEIAMAKSETANARSEAEKYKRLYEEMLRNKL